MRDHYIIAVLAVLIFSFLILGLGKLGLEFKPDENFYYQSSRRMLETGDFTTPYFFEEKRFEKPILFYWLVAGSMKLFGPGWAAARGVAALFAVLFLILLYDFCLSFYDRKTAVLSVLISATFLCFFRYARTLLPETAFLFFLFGFLYLFIKEVLQPKNRFRFIISYVFLAMAVLLKGPVAVIIGFLTLLLYFRISKRPFRAGNIYLGQGLLIMGILVLPWFVRMIELHGAEYLNHIFIRETKTRVFFITGAGFLKDLKHFLKGLVYFIPVVLYFYLPWSVFIPHALHREFKIQKKKKDAGLLLLAYLVVIFIFFSIIYEKHRHYMLYMTPALAVFIARFLLEKITKPVAKAAAAAIFIVTVLTMYFFGVEVNRHAYTLDEMFSKSGFEIRQGDIIATGSLAIHPYLVEANLARPIPRMCIDMGNEAQTFEETCNLLNLELFNPHPNRAFCLLTKEDYHRFDFKPFIKKTLKVIASAYVPKKPDIWNACKAAIRRDEELFWDSFREEVLLITNKPDS